MGGHAGRAGARDPLKPVRLRRVRRPGPRRPGLPAADQDPPRTRRRRGRHGGHRRPRAGGDACWAATRDRRVTAMRARELGRTPIVVGDDVDVVGDLSGRPDTLARIVRRGERRTVLRRTADDTDPDRARGGRQRRPTADRGRAGRSAAANRLRRTRADRRLRRRADADPVPDQDRPGAARAVRRAVRRPGPDGRDRRAATIRSTPSPTCSPASHGAARATPGSASRRW